MRSVGFVLFVVDYSPAGPFDSGLFGWFAKPAGLLHDYPYPARTWRPSFTKKLEEGRHPWISA
jgi:hypothetical protein